MHSVAMLNALMLSEIMLNVVMLNVIARMKQHILDTYAGGGSHLDFWLRFSTWWLIWRALTL
jgi:hypothetical protein